MGVRSVNIHAPGLPHVPLSNHLALLRDKPWPQTCRIAHRAGFHIAGQTAGVLGQAKRVDAVPGGLVRDSIGTPAQQRDRPTDVATLNVGDANGKLSQTLPEQPLLGRAVLPGGFEHLVGVKRHATIEQVLCPGQALFGQ